MHWRMETNFCPNTTRPHPSEFSTGSRPTRLRGGLVQLLPGMEYKQFIVKAFEHEPGKWRASVERANGKPLLASTRMASFTEFVTAMDTTTPEAAMQMALAAIDSGAFSRTHS
jgi:hypothetical protein